MYTYAGSSCLTASMLGGGFLFLHRLDMTQVMFLTKLSPIFCLASISNGGIIPFLVVKSRHSGPSPKIIDILKVSIALIYKALALSSAFTIKLN